MPQPALHLLLAERMIRHWREHPGLAPFRLADERVVNAFRHGCLAPDYGLFPGGDRELAAIAHTRRTGTLLRAVFAHASRPDQHAFAWGWLTHTLADVAIHPLINAAAAVRASGVPTLADHVRVEVGVDVALTWQHASLRLLRLRPAFDRDAFSFLAGAVRETHDYEVSTSQLTRMQTGMMRFTHAALHFATSLARDVCWDGHVNAAARRHPGTTALWCVATAFSPGTSMVNAYLKPVQPAPDLLAATARALDELESAIDGHVASGISELPEYNLENGTITRDVANARRVA